MAMRDYLPNSDEDLVAWFENFQATLPQHAANVGLTPSDVAQSESDLETLRFALTLVRTFRAEMRGGTPLKKKDTAGGRAAAVI